MVSLKENGFTIIELMIATAVFTVILTITTATLIGISNTYIKGSVEEQTQQTSRTILSDIAQDIQYNNSGSVHTSGFDDSSGKPENPGFFCVGNDVYVYYVDNYLSGSLNYALARYSASSCPQSLSSTVTKDAESSGAVELLSNGQRLGQLSVDKIGTGYQVSVEVIYGTDSIVHCTNNGRSCSCPSGADSSSCAVSNLSTFAIPRVQE